MTTYETYQEAAEACRRANRDTYGKLEVVVIVEGPEYTEYTVMDLREVITIEDGFSYEWVT